MTLVLQFLDFYVELFIFVFTELRPGLNDQGYEQTLKKYI